MSDIHRSFCGFSSSFFLLIYSHSFIRSSGFPEIIIQGKGAVVLPLPLPHLLIDSPKVSHRETTDVKSKNRAPEGLGSSCFTPSVKSGFYSQFIHNYKQQLFPHSPQLTCHPRRVKTSEFQRTSAAFRVFSRGQEWGELSLLLFLFSFFKSKAAAEAVSPQMVTGNHLHWLSWGI